MSALLPAALVFVAVAMVTLVLALAWEGLREWRSGRTLAARFETLDVGAENAAAARSPLVRTESQLPRWLQRVAVRVPRLRDLGLLMEQADLGWSPQAYMLLTGGTALGMGLATFLVLSRPVSAVVAAGAGAALPYFYARRRRARRMRAIEEHLPEAVDLMARALRAGHPFSTGIKMVADEIPDPVAREFRRVFEEQRFGLPLADALLSLADRVPQLDVRIFVTAVLIQREVGGNLAELLDQIANTVRGRFTIRRQIRVHTAQGRMTGYFLAVLPVLTGLAFLVINPAYVLVLFRTPAGHLLLGTVCVLQAIGFVWIRNVVDIDI